MEDFYRIRRLPPYVFEQVNRAKAAARNAGADIIDLGMGNPDLPAPAHVIDKLKDTLGKPRTDRAQPGACLPWGSGACREQRAPVTPRISSGSGRPVRPWATSQFIRSRRADSSMSRLCRAIAAGESIPARA